MSSLTHCSGWRSYWQSLTALYRNWFWEGKPQLQLYFVPGFHYLLALGLEEKGRNYRGDLEESEFLLLVLQTVTQGLLSFNVATVLEACFAPAMQHLVTLL